MLRQRLGPNRSPRKAADSALCRCRSPSCSRRVLWLAALHWENTCHVVYRFGSSLLLLLANTFTLLRSTTSQVGVAGSVLPAVPACLRAMLGKINRAILSPLLLNCLPLVFCGCGWALLRYCSQWHAQSGHWSSFLRSGTKSRLTIFSPLFAIIDTLQNSRVKESKKRLIHCSIEGFTAPKLRVGYEARQSAELRVNFDHRGSLTCAENMNMAVFAFRLESESRESNTQGLKQRIKPTYFSSAAQEFMESFIASELLKSAVPPQFLQCKKQGRRKKNKCPVKLWFRHGSDWPIYTDANVRHQYCRSKQSSESYMLPNVEENYLTYHSSNPLLYAPHVWSNRKFVKWKCTKTSTEQKKAWGFS